MSKEVCLLLLRVDFGRWGVEIMGWYDWRRIVVVGERWLRGVKYDISYIIKS